MTKKRKVALEVLADLAVLAAVARVVASEPLALHFFA